MNMLEKETSLSLTSAPVLLTDDGEKQNVFHLAACSKDKDVMQALIAMGLSVSKPLIECIDCADSKGQTPFMLAVKSADVQVLQLLCTFAQKNNGSIDVNAKETTLGNTALHFAGELGHKEVYESLKRLGCSETITNNKRQCPKLQEGFGDKCVIC